LVQISWNEVQKFSLQRDLYTGRVPGRKIRPYSKNSTGAL